MSRLRDESKNNADKHPRIASSAEEEREFAILAQFMRHETVCSLAETIAEPLGVRGSDLLFEAGLVLNAADGLEAPYPG
jgi:hypothetical protein